MPSENKDKMATLRERSIDEVGEVKFKQFYSTIREGKFDFKDVKKRFNPSEQKAIQSIEALVYMEDTMK